MKTHSYQAIGPTVDGFSFQVNDNLPEFLCPWLADWLIEYIASGAEFKDGQTLQFGFWPLKCQIENRQMRLLGSNFDSMPIKWVDDLSTAFHSMMVHKYVPESFGLEMDAPKMDDSATVGRLFAQHPMFMNRMPRLDNRHDSGWFLGSTRDDVDNNNVDKLAISLYEAALKAPWIHDFLSLPEGTQVVFTADAPVVLRNFKPLEPLPGSYMECQIGAD